MEENHRLQFFTLFLLSLFVVDVSPLDTEDIIGGQLATKGQFGYHVSIEVFGTSLCGGAIISKYYVITAAHCVIDRNASDFKKYPFKVVGATLDINRKDSSHQSVSVSKMYVPTRYLKSLKPKSGNRTGDIAVLKLSEPLNIEGNPYLSNVILPDDKINYDRFPAIVTGYGYNWVKLEKDVTTGKIEETDGGSNGKLRFAKTTILSRSDCQKNYKWTITKDHICARIVQSDSKTPSGVCSGDSGGPLVYNSRVLIGVVSSSPTGCRENIAAGIYTRVSSYMTFIRKAIWDQRDPEIFSKIVSPIVRDLDV